MLCDNCQKYGTCPMQSMARSAQLINFECNHYLPSMINSDCTNCPAFGKDCPHKPNEEDYENKNQYLIDKECGDYDCKKTVAVLEKKIRRYEEMIGSMLAAGQMITQHKEHFDKLRGVND